MEKAQYIVKKRMRVEGIGGRVNLPYGTRLEAVDGLILYNGAAVCATTSRNAHLYLARNDDGRGLERGALTTAITKRLEKRDKGYQDRWDLSSAQSGCSRRNALAASRPLPSLSSP